MITRTARAFTLIEILVTIAVCAILAGLAFPSLTAARARSRTALCLNNLHQLSVAWTLYSGDYGERWHQTLEEATAARHQSTPAGSTVS